MNDPLSLAVRRSKSWVKKSLGARIVVVFLGLLLVVQIASFWAIRASLWNQAHRELPEQLALADSILQSVIERRAQRLIDGAEVAAADYAFREAVASNDAETITSALANHSRRVKATEAALYGTDFSLRAATGKLQTNMGALVARLRARALTDGRDGSRASEIALIGGKPYQMVMVPMKAPLVVGWVMMGFPLDDQLVTTMQGMTAQSLKLTLLTRVEAGAPWNVEVTRLPAEQAAQLARQPWRNVPVQGEMSSVDAVGEELGVRPRWLTQRAARPADGEAGVLALTSISIDDAVRLPFFLQAALLGITLLGIAGFALGSVFTARRVTTPLRTLAESADRLGAGDYDTPMRGLQREDELGQLAQSFERMRVNVADKQQQILKLAYWDSLTGLPNRVQFRDAVREAIAQAEAAAGADPAARPTVAVLMLDLDRFKHVNDVLGYHFGDLLLKRVAERLGQHNLRGDDLVARLGGDEFAVLLRHGDAALAASVAQRITRAFDAPLTLEEHTVDMGAGIGMACWPEHASDADVLLSRAEVAMYAAKRRSDGPLMYHAAIDAASTQTLSLLSELRSAVDHNQLRLYLQPKLMLETGRVGGAEALVRWMHPQRGLVPPMEFIPFAEQTGFIRTLTMWVFEEAARHWLRLQAEGLPLVLSVNLSTRDLLDQELPQKFDALLVKHRVPAEAFCLEITESAIMDDPQRALGTLNRLSGLGFKLSIDDFGTGYSSLAYLKRLPVDELKIDKSFVLSMETDLDDAKIVRSTIDLAHNMGLTVVAEGVENAKVWDLLRELECDEAQGYHMGKPMPASEFQAWSIVWANKQRPRSAAGTGAVLH